MSNVRFNAPFFFLGSLQCANLRQSISFYRGQNVMTSRLFSSASTYQSGCNFTTAGCSTHIGPYFLFLPATDLKKKKKKCVESIKSSRTDYDIDVPASVNFAAIRNCYGTGGCHFTF